MKLSCIRKKNRTKNFQDKVISKDVRKMVVLSFIFLFNSVEVCHPLCKESKNIQFSPLIQGNKKETHDILRRSQCFIESDRYAAYAEA